MKNYNDSSDDEPSLEQLMKELQSEINQSKTQMSVLKSTTKTVKKDAYNMVKPKKKKITTKDVVMPKQPKYTFSKTQRFQEKPKEPPAPVDLNASQVSILSATSANDMAKKQQTGGYIGKSNRFSQKKEIDNRDYDYNINTVKQNHTGVLINPPKQQKPKQKEKLFGKFLEQQSMSSSIMDDLETQASMCEPGPGAYEPQYEQVQVQRITTMSKASRFPKQKEDTRQSLNPDRKQVQKSAPGISIKNTLPKTKQYLKKQQELKTIEDDQLKAYKQKPLENDKATKKHVGTAIMHQIDAAPQGSKQKKFMLFYLLDKLREERKRGPAYYEQKEEEPAPCMVKIRSHSTERRVPDNYQVPGPDYYYCKDDLCMENQPVFTFAKDGIEEKEPEMDRRLPLDIKEDLIKKRILGGNIDPVHSEVPLDLDDLLEMRMGPGMYDQNHKLTEKRTDIGAIKYQEITDKNDRQNNMEHLQKETYDNEDLNPDLAAVKPNIKGAVKMHDPVEQNPMYPPDSELQPEKWQFYDVNLDAVRENPTKNVQLAPGGKDRDVFMEHEEFMNNMRNYFERKRKMPEGYEVSYKQIDKKVNIPDLKKNLAKDLLDPIEKPDGEVDGDNLVLNPSRPKKKIPNVNLKKHTGRNLEEIEEAKQENENKDELLLQPQKPKKIKGFIDFKKQTKRPTYEEDIEDKRALDEQPPLKPNYEALEPKVKGAVDFKNQEKRPEGPKPKEQEVVMDIKQDQTKPRVKGGAKW